jgi:hypothetical protein
MSFPDACFVTDSVTNIPTTSVTSIMKNCIKNCIISKSPPEILAESRKLKNIAMIIAGIK